MVELEDAKKSGNIVQMKDVAQRARQTIDSMIVTFSSEESRRTLCTPRFDISSAVFIKNDISYDKWNDYVRSLPALSVPFPEFWMIWGWYDGDRDASFASRLKQSSRQDGSGLLSIETFVDIPGKNSATEEQLVIKIEGELELNAEMKATEIRTEGNDIILFIPLLHSLALLGCRNVKTTEAIAPRQLRRQVMRTHGVALCSYHIVTIGNNKSKSQARPDGGGHRGISICRGHFKTYDEHGLFGSRKGTWWWQSTARGGYEDGVTVRDYVLDRTVVAD